MDEDISSWRFAAKVISLCIVWFSISAGNNVVGKLILTEFPYPMTVSFVQLLSIVVFSVPTLRVLGIPHDIRRDRRYIYTSVVPLAFGKAASSVASHLSVLKVSLSYAHTVKATMPLFVVILSKLILKETQTTSVYMSLVPIVTGVAIATVTELQFNVTGLMSALFSTLGFALLNIYSKKALKETGIHHLRLLNTLSRIALIILTPFWFLSDFSSIVNDSILFQGGHAQRIVPLLIIDGFCAFAQNIVAFTFIALVSSLSYAVANSTKRIVVIAMALATFRNPVTSANVAGMTLSIVGVLLYNKAKYEQNRAKLRAKTLPYVRSEATLNKHAGMNNGYIAHGVPMPPAGSYHNGFATSPLALDSERPSLLLQNDSVEQEFQGKYLQHLQPQNLNHQPHQHLVHNNTVASGLNRYATSAESFQRYN